MTEEYCFVCGASEEKVRLIDAISSKGISKICTSCSQREAIPLLRVPTTSQFKESDKRLTYKERFKKELKGEHEKERIKTEISLRELIDRNYEKDFLKEMKSRPDLVDHFNWVIMRARMSEKITQEQLAKEISEPVIAIKMAEIGILPQDDYRLINKIEGFLGIKIIKDRYKKPSYQWKKPDPNPVSLKNTPTDDLKKIEEEKSQNTKGTGIREEFELEDWDDEF